MGKSPKEKLWLAGSGIAALLIAVIGWFFLISPQRQQTSDVEGQTQGAQLANTSLQSRISALSEENAKKASYQHAYDAAQEALPTSSDPASFLRIMHATADKTSTNLTALTIGTPQTITAPVPATPASPSSTSSSSSPSTPTGATGSGVYSIQITTGVTGSNPNLYAFLTQLQDVQPRAVLITNLTAGRNGDGTDSNSKGSSALQLTMQMFVLPETSAVAATPSGAPTSP
jgi:cytoskeletal protein RodZ